MTDIRVRSSKRKVVGMIRRLPKLVRTDRAFWVRIGLQALSIIKDAFLIKARGGTDAAGLKWPPLSPYTIAYKRRHPGFNRRTGAFTKGRLPGSKKRAGSAPSWMLTQKQRDRWWSLYGTFLHRYKGDKAHAAASAWFVLKGEGARTIMGIYGNASVEILRDLSLLYNSLTPAAQPDSATSSPPRQQLQIFKVGSGSVTLGTRRKWAWTHHNGTRTIPQRRLWPETEKWPAEWWGLILGQAVQAAKKLLTQKLT